MKKKALGFMLAATMTVSVLAGCGGNQNEGNKMCIRDRNQLQIS